ncbi:MAG: Zn-dependent hydrolase [Chloroflexi bacterium]|nr:Zn-dependent hydrolase [Chloroflexota bacterium]
MSSYPELHIDPRRLEADIMALAAFTRPDIPYTRLAFSEEDRQAREWVKARMKELGLAVLVDSAANIIGRREGKEPALGAIRTGSHVDTVRGGGRFDGMVGVAGALEAVWALNEAAITTRHPLEVVVFTAEEASVPGHTPFGSRAMAGQLNMQAALEAPTPDGTPVREALRRLGGAPERLGEARLKPSQVLAHLELHIEQGPELERKSIPIGAVTAIAAPCRGRILATGRADHAGATMMADRADALCAAAEAVLAVERVAKGFPQTVGTVGTLQLSPNMANVIPGRVEMDVEVRSADAGHLKDARARLAEELDLIAGRRRVKLDLEWLSLEEPVTIPPDMVALVEESAGELGIPCTRIISRASHDSARLAPVLPVGMVFVPSRGGKSHVPEEWTDFEQVALGTRVLGRALLKLDARL